MMTVHEVSALTGVSIRALRYYDEIGLLPPARYTEAGYRLYDDAALERLQQILLFRTLEFPLKEIRAIVNRPGFDRELALEQQIALLEMKRAHLDELIALARNIRETGGNPMDFTAFDTKKMEEYTNRAKAAWGETEAWQEYERKNAGRSPDQSRALGAGLMAIFSEFAAVRDRGPGSPEARGLVRKLQDYISAHYYRCTDEILAGLGQAYGCGGEFTENIDRAAGEGTAEFASAAIAACCEGAGKK